MFLNAAKIHLLHFGPDLLLHSYSRTQLVLLLLCRRLIAQKTLGSSVLLTQLFTTDRHISNEGPALFKPIIKKFSLQIFLPLHSTILRPHIQSCALAWTPALIQDMATICAPWMQQLG